MYHYRNPRNAIFFKNISWFIKYMVYISPIIHLDIILKGTSNVILIELPYKDINARFTGADWKPLSYQLMWKILLFF